MRILTIDIGTGTQDILLFDSSLRVENCIKMIMPSPTALIAGRISRATADNRPILLTGITMGGGPCKRALSEHIEQGLAAYATANAALTFHDNLEVVRGMGVTIVGDDDIFALPNLETIELKDIDLEAISKALGAFGVDHRFDAMAVAVLDHGFAPPGISNRLFRFDHLRQALEQCKELAASAYLAGEIPDYLTRMRAVTDSIDIDGPLLLLDTGIAAALGALQDKAVSQHDDLITVNTGNSHTIAFHLHRGLIQGLFEHHTGMLNTEKLSRLITRLSQGTLNNKEVYDDDGHGAVVFGGDSNIPFVAVTGPRYDLIEGSSLKPYRAFAHGDTMLAGCYGLVKAYALKIDDWREEIEQALEG